MDIDSNSLVRTTSVLQYTGVAGDNGQQVYCKATNGPGNNIESNECILHVRYPPSTAPDITASPSGLQYNTETTVNLTCQLSGGNPIATLSWICKKTGITGINQSNSTTAVAVLSLVMDSSYNNQLCTCTANHSLLTSPKSTSVSLTVFYVPNSAPQLTPIGFTSVDEGQNITLRCTLPTLGNPHVAWSWYCNEDTIPEGVSNTGTQSVLTFTAGRKYNQRTCHCRATTTRATLPYDEISIKQSITVFCKYIEIMMI
ncbi:nephrin-like [Saccostrea cucullata]|uniref:nephrin-like n=1 Tax=Saccostrea cuccullata TaxID=36930 RepID=UPI002ECFB4CC